MLIADTVGHVAQLLLGLVISGLSYLSLRSEPQDQPFRWAKVVSLLCGVLVAISAIVTYITGESISSHKDEEAVMFQSELLNGKEVVTFLFLLDAKLRPLPVGQALWHIRSSNGGGYEKMPWIREPGKHSEIVRLAQQPDVFHFKQFECCFLSWLSRRYDGHWLLEEESMSIVRVGTRTRRIPERWKYLYTRWSRDDVCKAFIDNPLQVAVLQQSSTITLPPGMTISVESRLPTDRTIRFENEQLTVVIAMNRHDRHEFREDEKQALRFKEHFGSDSQYFADIIQVEFAYHFKTEESMSPLAAAQHKWITEMITAFKQDFGWSQVAHDLRTLPIVTEE